MFKKAIWKEIDEYNMELFIEKLKHDYFEMIHGLPNEEVKFYFKDEIAFSDYKLITIEITKPVFDWLNDKPTEKLIFSRAIVGLSPSEALDSLLQYQEYYKRLKKAVKEGVEVVKKEK